MYIYMLCIYIYIYIYIFVMYTHTCRCARRRGRGEALRPHELPGGQDSSKGGAVETGCSDLYEVMY